MEIKAMKREYQMQQWKRIFQERQESGVTVKAWCTEREISENTYYYHLKKCRWQGTVKFYTMKSKVYVNNHCAFYRNLL